MTSSRTIVLAVANILGVTLLYNDVAVAGKKCQVPAGPSKGKTGTYTEEDGHTWCEGNWGATEYTGNSKCADALVGTDGGVVVVEGNKGSVVVATGLW